MRVLTAFTILLSIIALLCCAILTNAQLNSQVVTRLQSYETALNSITASIQSAENNRCGRLSSWTKASQGCNQPGAGNNFNENGFQCLENLGKDEELCGANCEGLIRSEEKGTVLFAPGTSNTDKNVQGFTAIGKQVEDAQKAQRTNGKVNAWMGYGDVVTGASRWFPGFPHSRSSSRGTDYDPRNRKWFISGSTGPKDIVLVLDVSGSMDNGSPRSRLSLMKSAVESLIGTMNLGDFFAVVTFNGASSGKVITASGQNKLLRANDKNKADAITAVKNIAAGGLTNFETGFQKAFDIFRQSTETTSGCARVILFLTDGAAGDSGTIMNFINNQQASTGMSTNKANIMTFTMSSGASKDLPREIACAHNGIHSHISDGVNPFNAMASYYKFLAYGQTESTNRPQFSEKYIDAFGLGELVTVSKSVFDTSGLYPTFVGVASIDIRYSELQALGTDTEILNALASRGSTCPTYNVTDCQLQILRRDAGYACPSPAPTVASCESRIEEGPNCSTVSGLSGGVNTMLCEDLNFASMVSAAGIKPYDEVACCEECALSTGAIVGIAVGATVGVAIIGGIVYLVFFKAGASAAAAGGSAAAGGMAATSAAAPAPVPGPAPSYPPQPTYGNAQPPQPQYGNQYGNNNNGQYGGQQQPQYGGQQQPQYGNPNGPSVAYGQPPPGGYGGGGGGYPTASNY